MKLNVISSSFFPATFYGGPIYSTYGLCKSLAKSGVKVLVSTTNANGLGKIQNVSSENPVNLERNLVVKYYNEQIINFFSISFFFNIWNDIKSSDIVYIQYIFHYTSFLGLLCASIQNKKVIICPRGSFSNYTLTKNKVFLKKIWLFLFKALSRKVFWHSTSYLESKDIIKHFPASNISVVNDGIDFDSFQRSNNYSLEDLMKKYVNKSFPEITDIIFSMGRLHHIKRFDVVIESFRLFNKKYPKSKLIIAGGDDGCKSNLISQIKSNNLIDHVYLIGEINHEDKVDLLSNCTIFSLASDFESFGIVIAEALASGAKVVISNKTPWKDLKKINYGILANNNAHDFFKAFLEIKKIKYDSEKGKKYVQNNFDWRIISNKFKETFLKF